MLTAETLKNQFGRSLDYAAYLDTGTADQRLAWTRRYDAGELSESARSLVSGFVREMNVLVCSGIWCGDCVQQCPLLERIAEASERVRLRFFDRDEHADFSSQLRICGGGRVPMVIFAAEDFEFVSLMGDRTLAKYRIMARQQLGPACPVPGAAVPAEETAAVLQGWLDEFERVQLLLRLSSRLRQKHGD